MRPVAGGAGIRRNPPPNLPKGPLFATKWGKSGVYERGYEKVNIWEFRTP